MVRPEQPRAGPWLVRAIGLILWAVLLIPCIVTPSAVLPYMSGKVLFFHGCIELALFFFIWLLLIDPDWRPRASPLFWTVLLYGAVLVIATVVSIRPHRSFWGDPERMNGLFTVMHGVIFFILLSGIFRSLKDWLFLFYASLVAGFFIGWYAFAQKFPGLAFGLPVLPHYGLPGATLGASPFLGTHAVFQIYFAGFILLLEKRLMGKAFGGLCLIFNIVILTLSANRGGIIGFGTSLMVGAAIFAIFLARQRKTRSLIAGCILLILLFPLGLKQARQTALLEKLPAAFTRMAQISPEDTTVATRILSLKMSLQAFKDRPLFGYGLENSGVGYARHFNPAYLKHENAWIDRSMNTLTETAVASGILGLAAYLAIFAALFRIARRSIRQTDRRPEERGAGLLVFMLGTAYFTLNLALFDTPSSLILFFAFLGFAGFWDSENQKDAPTAIPASPIPAPILRRTWRGLVVLMAGFLLSALFYYGSWRPFRTLVRARQVSETTEKSRLLEICLNAKRSGLYTYPTILYAVEEKIIADGYGGDEYGKEEIAFSREIDSLLQKDTLNQRIFLQTARLYDMWAAAEPSLGKRAEKYLDRVASLGPLRPEVFYEKGVIAFRKNQDRDALACFRKAQAILNNAQAHWLVGLAYYHLGERDSCLDEVAEALRLKYDWRNPADIDVLTRIYDSFKQYALMVSMYEDLVARQPVIPQYHVTLAIAHAGLGNKPAARVEALKAVALDRKYETVANEFIKQLGK